MNGKRSVLVSLLVLTLSLGGFGLPREIPRQSCAGSLITGLAAAPVALQLTNTTGQAGEFVIQSLDKLGLPLDGGATFQIDAGETLELHVGDWNPAAQSLCIVGDGIAGKALFGSAREVVQTIPIAATSPFVVPILHGNESTEITIVNGGQISIVPDLTLRDRDGNELFYIQLAAMEPSESETLDLRSLVPDYILDSAATATFGPAGVIIGVDLPRLDGRLLSRSGSFAETNTEFLARVKSGQNALHALAYNATAHTLTINYQLEAEDGTVTEGRVDVPAYGMVDLLQGGGDSVRAVTMNSDKPFGAMVLAPPDDQATVCAARTEKIQSNLGGRRALAATGGIVCGGISRTPGNPYTCSSPCLGANCVFYGWEAAYQGWGVKLPGWGNARDWWWRARDAGFPVDSSCSVGSIAVSTTLSTYGHVAWVTSCDFANKKVYVNQQDCYDKSGQTTIGRVWNMTSYQYYIHRPASPQASITATGSFGTARNGQTVTARVSNGGLAPVTFSSAGSTDGTGHQPLLRWLINGAAQSTTQASFSTNFPAGSYKVTLEATSSGTGLQSTAWVTINVQQAPVADLLMISGSQSVRKGGTLRIPASLFGTKVSFSSGTTRAGSAPITSYQWMYNGRVVNSQSTFTDRFFLRGTYQVLLRVTDRNGLFSDATATLIVY